MKPLNIALVYPHISGKSGYPRDFSRLATELRNIGVNVVTCSYDEKKNSKFNKSWKFIRELSKAKDDVSLVHFIGIFFHEYLLQSCALRSSRIPYIISPLSHLLPMARDKSSIKKNLFLHLGGRNFIRKASAIHSFGTSETESVNAIGFRGAIHEIPLGLYPEDLSGISSVDSSVELHTDGKPYIIFFGRLDLYQKGLDILIDGFESYYDQKPNGLNLVIAGRSWLGSGDWIKNRIEQSPANRKMFYLGEITDSQKVDLIRGSSALIYPSRFDGPPRPLRDAIALGKFVLASHQSNICPNLEREGLGWFFDANRTSIANTLVSFDQMESLPHGNKQILGWKHLAMKYFHMYAETK